MGREVFAKIDWFGTLYIDEVYFFYEEPQLFSCINKSGQLFLTVLTDMKLHKWIMVQISKATLSLLKLNKLSVRIAFLHSEEESFFRMELDNDTGQINIVQISIENIFENELPGENLYLDWPENEYLPVDDTDIQQAAIDERRNILDIDIEDRSHSREIKCDFLGKVLTGIQQLVYSYVQRESPKGRLPLYFKEYTMQVAGLHLASFGIRLKSNDTCDLLGENPFSNILVEIAKFFESKNQKDRIDEYISTHNLNTIEKLKSFFEVLLSEDIGLSIKGASPNNQYFHVKYTQPEIARNYDMLNGEIEDRYEHVNYIGTLVGINVDNKTFEFKTVEGEEIKGKVSDELLADNKFTVPEVLQIGVEKKTGINKVTKQVKPEYKLLTYNYIIPEQ